MIKLDNFTFKERCEEDRRGGRLEEEDRRERRVEKNSR